MSPPTESRGGHLLINKNHLGENMTDDTYKNVRQ